MASKKPIRIRGKRTATSPEKWRAQKRRKVDNDNSSRSCTRTLDSVDSTSPGTTSTSRRRKHYEPELSRLEQLPTEVIQTIFEYAANVNLAVVSPRLTSQLSSTHMYHRLTTQILHSVCAPLGTFRHITNDEISAAARLLESKFVTWPFMCSWLDNECKLFSIPTTYRDGKEKQYWQLWDGLKLSRRLLPPQKLLRASWSDDNRNFLKLFTRDNTSPMLLSDHPLLLEVGQGGLANAIKEGATEVVGHLVDFGICPDTELLRSAVVNVVNEGVDEDMVYHLLGAVAASSTLRRDAAPVADIYDPSIWAWVERARADGNPKGELLLDMFKDAANLDKMTTFGDRTVSPRRHFLRNEVLLERR